MDLAKHLLGVPELVTGDFMFLNSLSLGIRVLDSGPRPATDLTACKTLNKPPSCSGLGAVNICDCQRAVLHLTGIICRYFLKE